MSCEFCAFAASGRASVMVATGPSTSYLIVSNAGSLTSGRLAAAPTARSLLNGECSVHLRVDAAMELVVTWSTRRGERRVLARVDRHVETAVGVGRDGVSGRAVVVHGHGRAGLHRSGRQELEVLHGDVGGRRS